MKFLNKHICLLLFLSALSSYSLAQVRISNYSGISNASNSSAFIDASSSSAYNNTDNIGKGLLFPQVDLTKFTAFGGSPTGVPTSYPSRFDGMIVYNTTAGTVGVGATEDGTGAVTPGFWYYENKTTTLNGGTWKPLSSGGGSVTASNGLTATGSNIQLGGTMTVPATTVALDTTKLLFSATTGKVAIGGTALPTANSARFEVDGASANVTAYNAGSSTTIDFSKSNLAYTTASAGTFTLQNLKDGATYTLAVQGTTGGTADFTNASNTAGQKITCKVLNNRVTDGDALYTIIVMGATAYIYVATGFI